MDKRKWFTVLGVATLALCVALTATALAGKPVYWWFDVDVIGDMELFATSPTGFPADMDPDAVPAIGHATVRKGVAMNVVVNNPNPCLDLAFLEDHFNAPEFGQGVGTTCFGPGQITHYGTLDLRDEEVDGVIVPLAWYWVRAMGKDGETEIQYYLTLTGGGFGPNWPADEIGETAEVTYTHWELKSSGGGRANKVACSGSGDFETGVTITVTRIPKPTE